MSARRIRLIASAVALGATLAACNVPTNTARPLTVPNTHSTTPTSSSSSPAPASPAASSTAKRDLGALVIAQEDTGAHYVRTDWPHWDIVSGACDSRETALKAQGRGVTTDARCHITDGQWTSPYDGVAVTDAATLDIDHMVPLAEAARSGTRGWTRADKERYANDPFLLVAVTAKTNRAKGDQDPAKWLPALDRCGYVAKWVAVKVKYKLTVDQAEHDAIGSVLARC